MTIYYNPEDYGLEVVAALDLDEPDYSFDMLVVWRRLDDGQLLFSTDSGCSCPAPFEYQDASDLADYSESAVRDIITEAQTSGYKKVDAAAVADFWRQVRAAGG